MNNLSKSTESYAPSTLRVHLRRTLSSDFPDAMCASISCPRQGKAVSLQECLHCDFVNGMGGEVRKGDLHVGCSGADAAPTPRTALLVDMRTPVGRVMEQVVTCVRPDLLLQRLADLFDENKASGFVVTDQEGAPVGFVSRLDLLRALFANNPGGDDRNALARQGARVGDIMTPLAFVLHEQAPIEDAIELMTYEHVRHVPIIDAENHVVGIVSALDVSRWLGALSNAKRCQALSR